MHATNSFPLVRPDQRPGSGLTENAKGCTFKGSFSSDGGNSAVCMLPLWCGSSDFIRGLAAVQAFRACAGADGQHACMAAVELPASLPLSPSPANALCLQHVLRERFRIEASLQHP